jgi:hypothetical protein
MGKAMSAMFAILCVVVVLLFQSLVQDIKFGCWGAHLKVGISYTVTSVQVIKEDVYLTLEHRTGTPDTASEGLELRPYKFSAAAFRYPLKKDGTKLTVVEGPGYRYMLLE